MNDKNEKPDHAFPLPDNLPEPKDDGGADHLTGMALADISLPATDGGRVNLATISGVAVVYCYPMTGRPGRDLPDGWDDIPGARGCTPQACSIRDVHAELLALGAAHVFGMSTQDTAYQRELAERLHLPYAVLSDESLAFAKAMRLPVFEVAGMTLLKRLSFIARDGVIKAVHYPVFPADSDGAWLRDWLKENKQ